ncbi:hypothetical protein NGM10_15585 [Halorussus salilacus]|uniref:hypothetical protein n=1 Tax=Halorussus salilacus TaxID=2953750 RepID=UPI00209DC03D|nr:hypothetical protein [Halorussus salilacus]USZ68139.1 hypothetical protein NGM10_15585 [Halorussus salilacus]
MKRTLSAVVDRMKRLLGSSASGPEDGGTAERDAGPDLYECEACGEVFISRPSACSSCGSEEFSNVGTFE